MNVWKILKPISTWLVSDAISTSNVYKNMKYLLAKFTEFIMYYYFIEVLHFIFFSLHIFFLLWNAAAHVWYAQLLSVDRNFRLG